MSAAVPLAESLTVGDVMQDLEAGRSLPLEPGGRLLDLRSAVRPTLGGRTFLHGYLAARALGRIHPRLARPALLRLWFTPWVHPSALRPVRDVPEGIASWSLPVGDLTLQGYAGGAGPTVVLVHGWAGRAADWRYLAGDLIAAGWRIVAPDLPAHGRTAGRSTDLFEMSEAFAAVLDHEQPDAVVAHSMGYPTTMLALEAGVPAPDRIVAVAPGRKISHAVDGFAERARLRPALVRELRLALEERFGADVWEVLDVDRVVPWLASEGLVIHDEKDDEVPLADARAIVGRWPGARLEVTVGLGHRRILRDPIVRRLVVDGLPR